MTTVRLRKWRTRNGESNAWVVAYIDHLGVPRLKTFRKSKAAATVFAKQQGLKDNTERDTAAEKLIVQSFMRRRLAAFRRTPQFEVERARLIVEMLEWAE